MIPELKELFGTWMAGVAAAINAAIAWIVPQRRVLLVESEANSFTAQIGSARGRASLPQIVFRLVDGRPEPEPDAEWRAALRGSRIDILMRPDRVLLRAVDFPRQAVDFLDGMISAQIDRLTPWTVNEAVYGIAPPRQIGNDRIMLTLAATSKATIQPLLRLATDSGAASVTGRVAGLETGEAGQAITLFDRPLAGRRAFGVPQLLRITLLGACVAALASLVISVYVVASLETEQQRLQQQIVQQRAALRLSRGAGSAELLLAKRKQTSPASVMVLEAISRVLPDTTYVTELRIEGDKMQVVGVTQDAPSLIRLLEQSPQFSRATFFAPTTRAPEDPGERFHIEAHIAPYFGSGS